MYWDWRKAIGGMFRIGAVLLIFSLVAQNLSLLNKLSLVQFPIGSLLLLIFTAVILYNIYRTFKWYFTWLLDKKKAGSITNVIIHFCLYSFVFFAALSVPVPTLVSSDQPTDLHPAAVANSSQSASDIRTALPDSSTLGYYGQTVEHAVSKSSDIYVQNSSSSDSKYKTSPKTVKYEYVLRGNHYQLPYTVYGGMNGHLQKQPRYIIYRVGKKPPENLDFILKELDNAEQKPFIDPLVGEIEKVTSNKDDQARIAISLVQNLEYDSAGLETGNIKGKYPYEVLYTGCGVCSEKSELLAYMLRELGYEVVIFRFKAENHDAVGIKCPYQYSYNDTGYCFVESTSPSIITYSSGDYAIAGNSTIKLMSTPDILKICDGDSFDTVYEEYDDAQTWSSIGTDKVLDEATYNQWLSLVDKYGIKITKT